MAAQAHNRKGREAKREVAQETLSISKSGSYSCFDEDSVPIHVSISSQVEGALNGTLLYRLSDRLPTAPTHQFATKISVRNEDTVAGALRLVECRKQESSEHRLGPAVLNFASAKHPGGGFLSGATAQEECLARCSALYVCQVKFQREFYDQHNRSTDERSRLCLYSPSIIYSPGVPVFRSPDLTLMPQPFPVSFLTCPAVNMSNAERVGVSAHAGQQAMRERAKRVLQVMHAHGHKDIILGAWGCGVFRNKPEDIASIFKALLGPGGPFEGAFEEVVFSVLDTTPRKAIFHAFEILDNTQ